MLNFWKHKILEDMKTLLVESVENAGDDLLKYGIHIESFSFEVPKEFKKLFSYASRFVNLMYVYYDLEIPINPKEAFNFTSLFYFSTYAHNLPNNPTEFSFIKDIEEQEITQPKLFASFKFDIYSNNLTVDEKYVKKLFPSAKIWAEKGQVELVKCDLPFEIDYKVFYI